MLFMLWRWCWDTLLLPSIPIPVVKLCSVVVLGDSYWSLLITLVEREQLIVWQETPKMCRRKKFQEVQSGREHIRCLVATGRGLSPNVVPPRKHVPGSSRKTSKCTDNILQRETVNSREISTCELKHTIRLRYKECQNKPFNIGYRRNSTYPNTSLLPNQSSHHQWLRKHLRLHSNAMDGLLSSGGKYFSVAKVTWNV